MPTKTNKPSPLTLPPALIGTAVKGAAGALGGGYTAGMGELSQIRDEFKEEGFKEAKFGKKLKMLGGAGLRLFGAYQQGMLGGAVKGLTGSDMGIGSVGLLADNQPGAQEPQEEQPTYSTNMMKIPMTMNDKPLKMLTPYKMSYVAKNMKASEAKTAMKMQDISGSSTLPSPVAKMADKDYDGDGKIESSKEEYFGSIDNAIKENKNK